MDKGNPFIRYYALKTPCDNCPFLKQGAIRLREGRLAGIVKGLLQDDQTTFQCHKTVHTAKGGEWDSESGQYQPSGNEMACAGATAFMLKQGYTSLAMRLATLYGGVRPDEILSQCRHLVIDDLSEATVE